MTETLRMPTPEEWGNQPFSKVVSEDGYRIASRVIFPQDGDVDVMPLYLDRNNWRDSNTKLRPESILGRTRLALPANDECSLGSYFNAFQAGYWRKWTEVRKVRLVVNTSGVGQILVYRSTPSGICQRVENARVNGENEQSVFELPLTAFADGGFYWFDLISGDEEFILESAQWWVPQLDRPMGSATLSTTTYNKPDYIVRNLNLLSKEPEVLGVLDQVLIIDQGSQKVVEEDGWQEAKEAMNGLVDLIEQPNFGGSGGFARGQYEATVRGRSDYVILLDDDIMMEPESIIRLVTFADMCKKPTLVGGHMFELQNRSVLHTFGEFVEPYQWQYKTAGNGAYLRHDFKRTGLRDTAWMHSRIDVGYNGWWMCLIPTKVIREIGLSLPIFIKWDDAEYGVRAGEHGYHTVSLPGAAVWHMSWLEKDDMVGWQAYFHERNRLITALLHSQFPFGGAVLATSQARDLKHLVSWQYYTVAGRLLGQLDVLNGPDSLHEVLASRNTRIRAMAKEYSDGVAKPGSDAYPPLKQKKPRRPHDNGLVSYQDSSGEVVTRAKPGTRLVAMTKGMIAISRQFLPMSQLAKEHPQTELSHIDNRWWNVSKWDSLLVTNAEGNGVSWYQRNPKLSREFMFTSMNQHQLLLRRWNELSQQYRAALADITSFETWEKTFGINQDEPHSED